jgi:hypothetical protein
MKLTLNRLDLQTLGHEIGGKNEEEEIDKVVKYSSKNLTIELEKMAENRGLGWGSIRIWALSFFFETSKAGT